MKEIILIVVITVILILFIIIGLVVTFLKKKKTKATILNELQLHAPTIIHKNKSYDYELNLGESICLVKVLYNYRNQEISVNNKNYWQLNDKVVSSKRSGTKLEGIYDLVNQTEFPYNKPIKKIYLIYPSARVLLKAVNESELIFITPNVDCYGVNLVKFDELNKFFDT